MGMEARSRGPDPAVFLREVSKKYRLYPTPSHRLLEILSLGRRSHHEDFWALRDVGLEVRRGGSLGIIGANGSGKSTLLQLVAGIFPPTLGVVGVKGKVAALLELGAGFHPDLTGRENVRLSGLVHGLSPAETREREAEVVAFAEIGPFVDQPVKVYSSGMFVRLAFAAAICVDPEILLVDEALAVGDEYFQGRCIDRIQRMKRQGKTILFVSHNLGTVKGLCDEAAWVHGGRIVDLGETGEVVDRYLDFVRGMKGERASAIGAEPRAEIHAAGPAQALFHTSPEVLRKMGSHGRYGTGGAELAQVLVLDAEGKPRHEFWTGEDLVVAIRWRAEERIPGPSFGVSFFRNDGVYCYGTNSVIQDASPEAIQGEGTVRIRFRALPLLAGTYHLTVALFDSENVRPYDYHDRLYTIRVRTPGRDEGLVALDHDFELGEG